MKSLEEIKLILAQKKPELVKNYHIKELGIFGSYARGEQKQTSDVDLLIDYDGFLGLSYFDIEATLEKALGAKVDLVSRSALKKHIGQRILKELIKI